MDIEVVGGCIAIVKQLDGGQDNVFPPPPSVHGMGCLYFGPY